VRADICKRGMILVTALSIACVSVQGLAQLQVDVTLSPEEIAALEFGTWGPAVVPRNLGPMQPRFAVRQEKSHMIRMRDGARMSTDLYFPIAKQKQWPVVLIRTPYGKEVFGLEAVRRMGRPSYALGFAPLMAAQGYVVAVQDKRGQGESEGRYQNLLEWKMDRTDGYDTVTWLTDQPWSSGRIGTIGCSADGDAQVMLMAERHPNYVAAIPQAAAGGLHGFGGFYRVNASYEAGVFKPGMLWWNLENNRDDTPRLPADLPRKHYVGLRKTFDIIHTHNRDDRADEIASAKAMLPVAEMMKRISPFPDPEWEQLVRYPMRDRFWDDKGFLTNDDRFNVPGLHMVTWLDVVAETFAFQDLMSRNSTNAAARDHQHVIVGPGTHCDFDGSDSSQIVGERPIGDARFAYWHTFLGWFGYWLKGEDNGFIQRLPAVQAYILGENKWRVFDRWPPETTSRQTWYLASAGDANSRLGDGRLELKPARSAEKDSFVYDPAYPVPSTGEHTDQATLELRHDILVYTSEPVGGGGLWLTGPMSAELYVSSDRKDTDFTVKVVEVTEEGVAYKVAGSITRARYREGLDREVWLRPGEVTQVSVKLQPVGLWIAPEHRLRIEISSSDFPQFTRNLNTGGHNGLESEFVAAVNTVHHGQVFPSSVTFQVAREGPGRLLESAGQ